MKSLPFVSQELFFRLLEVSTGSAIRVPVISLPSRSKVDRIFPGKFYMIFSELTYDTCNPLFQLGHKGVDSLGSSIQIRLHINWTFFFLKFKR